MSGWVWVAWYSDAAGDLFSLHGAAACARLTLRTGRPPSLSPHFRTFSSSVEFLSVDFQVGLGQYTPISIGKIPRNIFSTRLFREKLCVGIGFSNTSIQNFCLAAKIYSSGSIYLQMTLLPWLSDPFPARDGCIWAHPSPLGVASQKCLRLRAQSKQLSSKKLVIAIYICVCRHDCACQIVCQGSEKSCLHT